jgi:hypothetical protein
VRQLTALAGGAEADQGAVALQSKETSLIKNRPQIVHGLSIVFLMAAGASGVVLPLGWCD